VSAAVEQELLQAARQLLDDAHPGTVSAWSRASALLTRQALECALDGYWARHLAGAERLSMRAQLACAETYLGAEIAGDLAYSWHALSSATHHRPYEMDPTREELASLISVSERVVDRLAVL
jgi:hypothetical protein